MCVDTDASAVQPSYDDGMTVIGLGDLFITRGYLVRYLRWATSYATDCIPDGMQPKGEFGVVAGDGTLRVVVPLVDGDGKWTASGIGPPCRPEWWAASNTTVH
jgi:hypothetical protein